MPILQAPSGSTERPRHTSQPSRKGKKAWRKNVDISEVEKGLAELNEEIIQGGPIAERDSAELFAVDTVGDARIKKQLPRALRPTLKADEIIAQRSKVPAVSSCKRASDKTTDGLLPAKRVRNNYVTHKELARIRKVADGQHDQTIVVKDATYDIWGAPPTPVKAENELSFIPPEVKAKVPDTLREKPVSLAANGKEVPAVRKPDGGYSYNPTFSEYEKRLTEEGAKAVEAEEKRLAALEEDKRRAEAAARSAAEAEAAEARAELSEWDEDSEWEGFQSGAEDVKATAKRPQRKTRAQRNRIQRRKEEEREKKHELAMKRKLQQLDLVKKYAREATERELALELAKEQQSDSESEGDEEKLRRRKLGKAKVLEKDLELVLPDELADSLRLLKPEGNLLRDRYRNMVVRGKLESRKHIPYRKQGRAKMTEKWTHKDFMI